MCVPAHGLPPFSLEGLNVWVVPPPLLGSRKYKVISSAVQDQKWYVTLSGIKNMHDSELLVGRKLLMKKADIPPELLELQSDFVVGKNVYDANLGFVGTICAVSAGPLYDFWQVTGPFGEVIIPAAKELIYARGQKRIDMRLPQGLIELAHKDR